MCCNDHKEASQLICNLAPATLCFGSALERIIHPKHLYGLNGLPVKNKSVNFFFPYFKALDLNHNFISNPNSDFLQQGL